MTSREQTSSETFREESGHPEATRKQVVRIQMAVYFDTNGIPFAKGGFWNRESVFFLASWCFNIIGGFCLVDTERRR